MLKSIISLSLFLASFILPWQVHAFSIFDEGMIAEGSRERLNKSSNKVDFLNRVYFDIVSQDNYDATSEQNELMRTSARVDLVSQIHYNKKWFIYTNFRFAEEGLVANEFSGIQTVPKNGNDQFFNDHAGVLRELNFGYEDDDYKLYAGKFRPKFGYAWNLGRGVNTNSLSSSYMQSERIGYGGEIKAGDKKTTGAYNLGLAVYKYDRKYLDNSLFTSRREVSKNNGIASDTKSPESYTINLDIDFDFESGNELFYRFAYSKQKFDEKSLALNSSIQTPYHNQEGYSYAMNYKTLISDNLALDSLVEYVETNYSQGSYTSKKDSVTNISMIANIYKNWNITAGSAQRRVLANSGISSKFIDSELTFGYRFDKSTYFDGLQIQLGAVHTRSIYPLIASIDDKKGGVVMLRYVKWL